jgi:hypothetical protein
VTNLFLYGTSQTPVELSDRIRAIDVARLAVQLDAVSLMLDGPGRFALPTSRLMRLNWVTVTCFLYPTM